MFFKLRGPEVLFFKKLRICPITGSRLTKVTNICLKFLYSNVTHYYTIFALNVSFFLFFVSSKRCTFFLFLGFTFIGRIGQG